MAIYDRLALIVEDHALVHYFDQNMRWDYIIETKLVSDIAADLKAAGIRSRAKALAHFEAFARLMDEMESECY